MNAWQGRLCVVLGMHRAGTSATTRALTALGIELGENLMPPASGNNAKGFFEDLTIVAINDQLLAQLGSTWQHFLGEQDIAWQALFDSELGEQACNYLSQALSLHRCFAIKDPRLCRLLPFWQQVFAALKLTPDYVLAVRDPLSVAASLEARDGLDGHISQLLWLEHYSLALKALEGQRSLCISYDQLLDHPDAALARLSGFLQRPLQAEPLAHYKAEFLDQALRHSQVPVALLEVDTHVQGLALALYRHLLAAAHDQAQALPKQLSLDVAQVFKEVARQSQHCLQTVSASLKLAAAHSQLAQQQQALEQVNSALLNREQQLEQLNGQLQNLYTTLHLTQESLAQIYASHSWRLSQPIRALATFLRKGKAKVRRTGKALARKVYYRLPEPLRRRALETLFGYAGFAFKGLAHYENWRHLQQLVPSTPLANAAGIAFNLASEQDRRAGRYQLIQQSCAPYCYLPPRRSAEVELRLKNVAQQPLISILTPVYGVEPRYLERLVQSVLAQWYSHWELILVEDAGPNPATREYLKTLDDPRIRVKLLAQNLGIAGATNVALEMARGSYVAFLDHDDELTVDALYELAKAINQTQADFIYSDEDKIDADGRFSAPFFKPDWSPDALLSIMYTCHLSCMRTALVREVGGLRSAYDGAQDYDLVLRITERTTRIAHIAKVLYHWRSLPSSLAGSEQAKPYAGEAVRRLKEDALKRRGLSGVVEPVRAMPGQFRVRYLPQSNAQVAIIIPSRDNAKVLRQCVESILSKTRYAHFQVWVVDNQSVAADALEYFAALEHTPKVQVLRYPHAFNYSAINNFAAAQALGEYLLFLNDDTQVLEGDWLERLLGFAEREHVGAVGAQLIFPDTLRIQHCGVMNLADGPGHGFYNASASTPQYFGRNVLEWNWLAVTGACLLVARRNFVAIGGFDESLPIAYNDIDLCLRLHQRGLHNVCCNAVQLLHYESLSRGVDHLDAQKHARLAAERRKLYSKHPSYFMQDPYYNKNLHSNSVDFLALNY